MIPPFLHKILPSLFVGFTLLFAPATLGAASKPPETGELYSYEGTLSLEGITADSNAAFGISTSATSSRPMIKVDFPASKGYPGINFPASPGWDLSGFSGVQIDVNNPGKTDVSVYLRVGNTAEGNAWSVDVLRLQPGETKTLKVPFGKEFGKAGYALDPGRITSIKLFTDPVKTPFSVLLTNLRAYKASAAAAASSAPKVAAGASKPYITRTTSPTNHERPYGQDLVLVKDWTFGKSRPDATIRNRDDLDKEFFYRYIYDKGRLDTLSTYWTIHRDYPEDSPKSLHVFGPDTLTLKARIPEGGGLRKGGIESGMLRGKFPVVPGMYVEMRAKLTRGIGAWPAFWLNPGVQYPDGTFSALPWPPEIDIFEFFNWQGREKTRELAVNIQTNKQPQKYGNPYAIFSALNKDNEYVPGMDFSEDFHVFALDWHENRPIWLLDGHPIKQVYYEWNAPPAHVLVTNQIGIEFAKEAMKHVTADESNWDYVIDYIRIWQRRTP
ncbi:MAG: hypothetical protein K0R17_955 [Rariglobus sp.]|jgi:hypothetical protein|nr:hypothetical protein [Rariglobus sp.]